MGWLLGVVVKIVINGLALWLAAVIVPGIHIGEQGDTSHTVTTVLVVAVIFGIVNAILKPILTVLSLPFIVVTLGLFLLVVNAILLQLTSWISGNLDLAFHVDHFWWDAVFGALIITVVASVLNAIVPDRDRSRARR
ncbi:MAG: phage holin family protein [Lapillicoccus sp.]